MKVHCTHCDAPAELDGLVVVPGGFGFVCPACGGTNVLAPAGEPAGSESAAPEPTAEEPAAARGAVDDAGPAELPPSGAGAAIDAPPPSGTVECPKCQHWQPQGDASCHRCGLMFAYAATGRARLPDDPLAGHAAADTIRRRWSELANDLDDRDGHEAFIRMCAESGLLEYAGQCYRRLADRGVEHPAVADYRKRVLQAAMVRMGRVERRETTRDKQRTQRMVVMLVAAAIVFILAFGYYLLSKYQLTRSFEG